MSKVKLVINAGHGMGTSGKRCAKAIDPNETRENWLNRRVADKVCAILDGYDVDYLRTDDVTGVKDIPLSTRTNKANSEKVDAYYSIHHNAAPIIMKKGGGVVVICYPNEQSKAMAQRLYNAVVAANGNAGNRSTKIVASAWYHETRCPNMPSFIIENGFMNSWEDTPRILTEEYAANSAQGIAQFIIAEHKLKPKSGTGSSSVKPTITEAFYTVQRGDTLSKIALKYGTSYITIANLNGIKAPYTIYVGQKLRVK